MVRITKQKLQNSLTNLTKSEFIVGAADTKVKESWLMACLQSISLHMYKSLKNNHVERKAIDLYSMRILMDSKIILV
jgi:hypothetical protein